MKKKRHYGKEFRLISIVFIIGCCLFYGNRLIKYYKIFNPTKSDISGLISVEIPKKNVLVINGDGLYFLGGSYVYRGEVKNNYIMFSNMLFRIIKINYGSSMVIALDKPINSLSWDKAYTTYDKSDLNKYLNDIFLAGLNKDMLTTSSVCLDKVTTLDNIKCESKLDNVYVKPLDLTTILNSTSESSFLYNEDQLIWLSNIGDNVIWHTNGTKLSTSNSKNIYDIKPVVTLNYNIKLLSGTGVITDPYIIEPASKTLKVGNYIKLGNDTWRIYEKNGSDIKLVLNDLLGKTSYFSQTKNNFDPKEINSLAYYLNNTYYDSLSYKDLIKDTTWYTGLYDGSYTSIKDKSITAHVGLLNVSDIKLSTALTPYYLLNAQDLERIYTYSNTLTSAKGTLSKGIKPVITIATRTIKSGDGTVASPFILEV